MPLRLRGGSSLRKTSSSKWPRVSASPNGTATTLRWACIQTVSPELAEGLHLSISIGMAELREDDAQLKDLVARADAALYRAKANGRNRIEAEAREPELA